MWQEKHQELGRSLRLLHEEVGLVNRKKTVRRAERKSDRLIVV